PRAARYDGGGGKTRVTRTRPFVRLAFIWAVAGLGCVSAGPVPASSPAPVSTHATAQASDEPRQVASLPAGDGAPASDAAPPEPSEAKPAGDDAQTTAIPIPGTDHVRGRSKVLVHAPIGKVREAVLGF